MEVSFEQNGRSDERLRKHMCPCCRPHRNGNHRKEPRCVSRAVARGKAPIYAPFHSVYVVGEPELNERINYIGGVSSWKRTMQRKGAVTYRIAKMQGLY